MTSDILIFGAIYNNFNSCNGDTQSVVKSNSVQRTDRYFRSRDKSHDYFYCFKNPVLGYRSDKFVLNNFSEAVDFYLIYRRRRWSGSKQTFCFEQYRLQNEMFSAEFGPGQCGIFESSTSTRHTASETFAE